MISYVFIEPVLADIQNKITLSVLRKKSRCPLLKISLPVVMIFVARRYEFPLPVVINFVARGFSHRCPWFFTTTAVIFLRPSPCFF